jgi:hypothetical protein
MPDGLATESRQIWQQTLDGTQKIINGLQPEQAWSFVLSTVFSIVSGDGYPLFDQVVTGTAAAQTFRSEIKGKRALLVIRVDKSKVLKDCHLSNTKRTLEVVDRRPVFITKSDVSLPKGMDKKDFAEKLLKANFRFAVNKYRLFGTPAGVRFMFNMQGEGIELSIKMQTKSIWIPDECLVPIPSWAIYEKLMMEKLWLGAVKEFRFQSVKRKFEML